MYHYKLLPGSRLCGIVVLAISAIDLKRSIVVSMDFRGQELAERLYQSIILFFTVISFVMGYATQDFSLMIKLFGGGTGIAALVTLFDWPMFNKDPVKWRKPTRLGDGASSGVGGSKSPGAMEILWNLFN